MRTKTDVIDLEENKSAYVKKMSRQIKEAQQRIKEIEKNATKRNADENPELRGELDNLQDSLDELNMEFGGLKEEPDDVWADRSKDVSEVYRELMELIDEVDSKISRK